MDGKNDRVDSTALDDYPLHVYTTWRLSYDRLSESAQTLLRICAHLHHTGITEQMFKDAFSRIEDDQLTSPAIPFSSEEYDAFTGIRAFLARFGTDARWDDDEFRWCIQEACSSSLLSFDQANKCYSIHPLVHDCLRSITVYPSPTAFLFSALVWSSLENEAVLVPLFPHAQQLLKLASTIDQPSMHPVIVEPLGLALGVAGKYRDVEKLYCSVLDKCRQSLGPEHTNTVIALIRLSHVYLLLERYEDARIKASEALDIGRRALGPNHLVTHAALTTMATTMLEMGNYQQAEKTIREVLEQCQRIHPPDHHCTLMALSNLATAIWALTRSIEAERIWRIVLEKMKCTIGPDHPDTIRASANLANMLWESARVEEAEQIEREMMEKTKTVLGGDHDALQAFLGQRRPLSVFGHRRSATVSSLRHDHIVHGPVIEVVTEDGVSLRIQRQIH